MNGWFSCSVGKLKYVLILLRFNLKTLKRLIWCRKVCKQDFKNGSYSTGSRLHSKIQKETWNEVDSQKCHTYLWKRLRSSSYQVLRPDCKIGSTFACLKSESWVLSWKWGYSYQVKSVINSRSKDVDGTYSRRNLLRPPVWITRPPSRPSPFFPLVLERSKANYCLFMTIVPNMLFDLPKAY